MSARSPICLPGASEWTSRYKIQIQQQIQMQSRNHCRQSDEWTATTSSLWSFVWRVTSSAELTASSIHHSLSHSPCLLLLLSRLRLTLILIYALYICSRMWIRCGEAAGHLAAGQNGLKQLPHIVKLPALSAATWLATLQLCNSDSVLGEWFPSPLPHPFPGCASTTFEWRLTVKEAVARRTRMENAKWLKDAQRNRTKMSPSRAERKREKVKKAFAKWKRIKLP